MLQERSDVADKIIVNRRDFIKTATVAGAGLVIGFHLPFRNRLQAASVGLERSFAPNAWIIVRPDDQVVFKVTKSEMGQGVWTSLPMIIAEEMDLDWSTIRVEQALESEGTGGSRSIRGLWTPLRKAGAKAKDMLLEAAAQKWKVGKNECVSENGTVHHKPTGKKIRYGDLAIAASKLPIPYRVPLKDPSDFKLIGTDALRIDTPLKINGRAQFAMDVNIEGMVYAFVVRCPIFGGTLGSIDKRRALSINGVLDIFEVSNGVAIVGSTTWAALQGRKVLDISWKEGTAADLNSDSIDRLFKEQGKKKAAKGRNDGNTKRALRNAETVVEAVYQVPFQAHAAMEPMNCVVDVQPDRCRLWAPTQSPGDARKQASEITGLPKEKIDVNVTFLGGSFGRRSFNDFISDALEVSYHMKRPVKLIWMREDDMRHDYYRPASRHIMAGGLGKDGKLEAWKHRVVAPSILFGQMFKYPIPLKDKLDIIALEGAKNVAYAIPNIRVEYRSANTAVPVGWWRSVYDSQNAYANECFMDELAESAGQDPLQFRLTYLTNSPRDTEVLKMVAKKVNWGQKLSNGRSQGLACHASFRSHVAQVAEVSVNSKGMIRVHRVVCAIDCGQVVNPSIVRSQIESSIVYGLSAALKGEIAIENGGVVQGNFHEFEVLRFHEMPKVEVYIVKSDEHPGGVGEPGLPPIAPAIANAVFAATGKRIRKLPIKPEDLRS